jgi:type III pantothenate kinase
MIWAVLIGNTRAVAALMKGTKVLQRQIVPTPSFRKSSFDLKWAKSLRKKSDVEGIVVASVVPWVDSALRRAFRKEFGINPIFVTHKSKLGIHVKVKKPAQVGADRLANAVAAQELYGAPSIVVDFGTGTTFDVLDRSGAYCGGAILPGIGTSLRALHEFTAKIPVVKFEPIDFAVGKTTEEAVRSGVYHGAVGTTRELLVRIREEVGTKAPAVATGGWCRVFEKTGLFHRIEPDLTLKGLELIWHHQHA